LESTWIKSFNFELLCEYSIIPSWLNVNKNSSSRSIVVLLPKLKSCIIQNSERLFICSTSSGKSFVRNKSFIIQFVKPNWICDDKEFEADAVVVRTRDSFDGITLKIWINKPELIVNGSEKKTRPSVFFVLSNKTIDWLGKLFDADEKNDIDELCTDKNVNGIRSVRISL
jgi:hypothetical protein